MKKVNNMSASAKASFWFIVSNIALKGISFITTPIFTRLLEVADYGTTGIFVTWEGVISVIATLNLAGGVYNVAMTKYSDDIDAYTSSMFVLETILSAFVYAAVIAFNALFPQVFRLSSTYLIFMWIQTLTNAFVTFWLMRLRFEFRYKPVIAYSFANALLSPTIAIVAIRLFPENMAMAKVIGSGLFGIVLGLVIMIFVIRKGRRLLSGEYWKYSLRFNIPLLPHYLSGILLSGADRLMIDGMVSRAAAGIYIIANSISGVLGLITGAINSIMIPVTLQSIKKQDYNGLKRKITSYMLIIAVFCVAVIMFSREAVLIFASKKYLSSIPYVPPLVIAGFLSFGSGIVGNIQFYYEKTWQMSLSTIIVAFLNIVLNYFAILRFGALAASYTTLFTSVIHFLLYYFFARKNEKHLNEILDLPKLLLIFSALIVYGAAAIIFETKLPIRIIFVSVPIAIAFAKRKDIVKLLRNEEWSEETGQEDK